MARLLLTLAILLGCSFSAAEALALGADHPPGPVSASNWPEGLKEMVNRPDRVHGFFVNESDVLFYDGDTKALNQFLESYARLKEVTLRVVIHAGGKNARSPWDKAERKIPVTWMLSTSSHPFDGFGAEGANRFHTRVDVWLGSTLRLDELRIPAGIEATSGGEIEKFLSDRKSERK